MKITLDFQRAIEYTSQMFIETGGDAEPTDQELRDLADYVAANVTLSTESLTPLGILVDQEPRSVSLNP